MSFNNPATNSFQGAFSLDEVHTREVNRDYPDTAGYVGTFGWITGGGLSTVDRIDFSNDLATATVRGSATNTYQWVTGVGNNNFGWFAGLGISYLTTVTRITFSNDTVTSVNRSGGLSSARNITGGLSNKDFGWIAGGITSPTTYVSTIDRIDFSNDLAVASLRGTLTQAKSGATGAANAVYGWFGGGYFNTPALYSRVERLDFSSDTTTPLARGSLTFVSAITSAAGNSNYGWWNGGNPGAASLVSRVDFSNDSVTASARGLLAHSNQAGAATGNATSGWFAGGLTVSSVSRVDYANDTTAATLRGPLSSAKGQIGGTSNYVKAYPFYYPPNSDTQTGGFGWVAGGGIPGPSVFSTVDRINFSNDTVTASVRSALTTVRSTYYGSNNSNYGWIGGGSGPLSSVERIDYANDLTSPNVRGPLTQTRNQVAVSNNQNYGWYAGGIPPAQLSSVDRIDFSNDSVIAILRGVLTLARQRAEATGTDNYGWFVGGNGPGGDVSTVERLDYATDLVTPTLRGNMPVTIFGGAGAVSNLNFGWFANTSSTLYRIDFSNDTAGAASPRGTFSVAKTYTSGSSGNANYGWFSGGAVAGVATSVVERMDYSNDNTTTSSRGPISAARYSAGGASNYVKEKQFSFAGNNLIGTFGWFGSGYAFPAAAGQASNIDRIDFSNDSVTAAIRTVLTAAGYWASASSNNNYRWEYGGFAVPGFAVRSNISRLDFSNDTSQPTARSNLPVAIQGAYALGNSLYGWNIGGLDAGSVAQSTVHRLEYANDASSITARLNLPTATSKSYATANANYGWHGLSFSLNSLIYRIDFSNDASSSSLRGPMTSAKYNGAATSNSIYGWFGGGKGVPAAGINNVDRIDFANDTVAALARGTLVVNSTKASATGNLNYGWWGGLDTGTFPGARSIVSRIDYSNDSVTASQRGPLSSARYGANGASNYVKTLPQPNVTQYRKGPPAINIGWFGGGYSAGSNLSSVDRIDFNSDTLATTTRGRLSSVKTKLAASANANYGWFSGGYSGGVVSSVDRLDFSNDIATARVRGPLSQPKNGLVATGNSSYSWVIGGAQVISFYSTVDRIDFANESLTIASVRASLSAATYGGAATGNANYGWAGGGVGGIASPRSTVHRIDFSNDSGTPLVRGPLESPTRSNMGALSNINYGWFVGGVNAPATGLSTLSRIDFSNDSISTTVRGILSSARGGVSAASSANFGWVILGYNQTPTGQTPLSTIDRIDFANDTATASIRGPSPINRSTVAAISDYVK